MGRLNVVYVDPEAPGLPREFYEIPEEKRSDCLTCYAPAVRRVTWQKLPAHTRKLLKNAGVKYLEARNLCRSCYGKAGESGNRDEFPVSDWAEMQKEKAAKKAARKAAVWDSVDLPALWRETTANGGSYREIAEQLGLTAEYVRQSVKKLGLPQFDKRIEDAKYFLEELEHLAGLGMGVQYIANALGMEPDRLVKKVNNLRGQGRTEVKFDSWHPYKWGHDEEMEAA
jgi:hypothetical protein